MRAPARSALWHRIDASMDARDGPGRLDEVVDAFGEHRLKGSDAVFQIASSEAAILLATIEDRIFV